MNLFENLENVLTLTESAHPRARLDEVFRQAADLRGRLGRQGYLLDQYLRYFFTMLREMPVSDMANDGIAQAGRILGLVTYAATGEDSLGASRSPFSERMRAFVADHPTDFQEEETTRSYYAVPLFEEYVEHLAQAYLARLIARLTKVIDYADFTDYYKRIAEALGGEAEVDQLNALLVGRFLTPGVIACFHRGATEHLLHILTHRDEETSKEVFQLLLDRPALF